jgi:hypothetical protein
MPRRWRWNWLKSLNSVTVTRRIGVSTAIACALALAACRSIPPDPLVLDGATLIVNNRSAQEWTAVEIWLNTYYRVTVPSIAAGGRLTVPLNTFINGFGYRFDFHRAQIKDLRLTATQADGKPVEIKKAFEAGGLNGALGGVGGKR